MAVAHLDTIAGVTADDIYYHLDVQSDVLYLRLSDKRWIETLSHEDDEGYIVVCDMATDDIIGVDIIGYWAEVGQVPLEEMNLKDFVVMVAETARKLLVERLSVATRAESPARHPVPNV